MLPSELNSKHKRTSCSCEKCVALCKTIPGPLAPGDFGQIADYLGVEFSAEWLEAHFRADEPDNPQIPTTFGTMISTLSPAQREDGRCVFLTDDDQCRIHPVSPFGCSRVNACSACQFTDELINDLVDAIQQDAPYALAWGQLHKDGMVSRSKEEQLADLKEAIDRIKRKDKSNGHGNPF